MKQITEHGRELVKSYEKLILTAYDDGYGYLTIGYGHTSDKYYKIVPGASITKEKAIEIFKVDLFEAGDAVDRELLNEDKLSDNQYSAIVSTVFNCGSLKAKREGRWIPSELMIALNEMKLDQAAELLKTFKTTSAGKPSLGLRRRRLAEYFLFTSTRTSEMDPVSWAKWARSEADKLRTV